MVFDEGFEVRMRGGRSFFAHFKFEALPNSTPTNGDRWTDIAEYVGRKKEGIKIDPKGETYSSYCNETSTGWWHRKSNGSLQSGCFWASKRQTKEDVHKASAPVSLVRMAQKAHDSPPVAALASMPALAQDTSDIWEPAEIARVSGKVKEVLRMRGEASTPIAPKPMAAVSLRGRAQGDVARHGVADAEPLPKTWDWRKEMAAMNPGGIDDLSEQFSQGNCGSCYAFSGAQVLQMRFRIQLYRKHQIMYPLELSWKTATQCSPYTEGCNGGFAYLAFKQAAETGLPLAECDAKVPPNELDASCDWSCYRNNSMLFYAKDYGQTGGFAQGATEESIMREIYNNGPVIMSFSTSAALEFIYNNGVSFRNDTDIMTLFKNEKVPKEPASANPQILPWRYTTHSILCVGFGEEVTPSGKAKKYWIVRNSWGRDWGTNGYAKMRRGFNDAAIETSSPWVEPDMDRLPPGFLEHARQFHEKAKAKRTLQTKEKVAAKEHDAAKENAGGRPAYCKLRPDSPDCK